MNTSRTRRMRILAASGASIAALALIAGCSSDSTEDASDSSDAPETSTSADAGRDVGTDTGSGETVVIGFSGPAADHGWLGAINSAAVAQAETYDDVDLRVAEG